MQMTSTPPHTLASTDSFDERLRNVYSFCEAISVLNEYLSTIPIDNDNPGFVLSWDMDNLHAFVAAANALDPARAPDWLQTRPPLMTVDSFIDDFVCVLEEEAGGRCGRVLLAPNTQPQVSAIVWTLCDLRHQEFLQDAAQDAFHDAEQYLVRTYSLTETNAQRVEELNLPPSRQHLHRIFI